jgi:hypothetical protein
MPANNPKPANSPKSAKPSDEKPSDEKPTKAAASADSVDTDTDAPGVDGPQGEEAVPMNRAERRAKGKAAAKPPIIGKIQPGRTNQNHGPRSYANRRSG